MARKKLRAVIDQAGNTVGAYSLPAECFPSNCVEFVDAADIESMAAAKDQEVQYWRTQYEASRADAERFAYLRDNQGLTSAAVFGALTLAANGLTGASLAVAVDFFRSR